MTDQNFDYLEGETNKEKRKDYSDYQKRYEDNPRESDKAMAALVVEACAGIATPRILDVGCSTGNFLRVLKKALPEALLFGADLVQDQVDENRQNDDLSGIEFERINLLEMDKEAAYDVVVTNAVCWCFDAGQFETVIGNLARGLKPGGSYISFEMYHPYPQEVTVTETWLAHPNGLTHYIRPMKSVRDIFLSKGFKTTDFHPFDIPIELPKDEDREFIMSHTEQKADGGRLIFHGIVHQPWCHTVARRG
ncbi:trans-aconitate 2-methyltransferase [Magnetospira sp. QH-2]|uniref:class I SAM-dependent methyltransferase n=1 Tax=Magnetospira sp. (strain QH-2) TaxID=1288970 RepID=UPI0003E80F51|nr:class I SAM-dependent methyltransferase [Magnetospira sp. QH-2]CCQ73068.1 conserved protein of unknown function [methyltransferase domain] [Magnetospira sp. QH-2]